jgi:hypothetical protein
MMSPSLLSRPWFLEKGDGGSDRVMVADVGRRQVSDGTGCGDIYL